ncbi:DUF4260 domain-containing protein [Streptomyces sp. NBC_01142]|uniref:DUF4260 family protein n=1 Tax=Streptomyces sp. NBC_01142 TaxID=2975865 RepID=UPI00224E5ECB|nr:DUF4260 family protein [Streptomyces sp. NBC_01142]MCX4820520.1 DUF4260 domain-containing protein [Streptomyces sp. NBC_01142]
MNLMKPINPMNRMDRLDFTDPVDFTGGVRGRAGRGAPGGAPIAERTPGWSYHHPCGRALSGVVGAAALVVGARIGGARSRVLWTTALLPDIALLYGIAAAPGFERLPSYAVRPYNVLHSPAVPAALLALAAVIRSRRTAVAGLGWLGHIAVDRAFGYGPRRPDGLRY